MPGLLANGKIPKYYPVIQAGTICSIKRITTQCALNCLIETAHSISPAMTRIIE